ncbi:MAG: hypothetical protein P8Y42_19785 [Exilibacterium sp.]
MNEADTLLGAADTMSDALTGQWQDYMRGRASGNRPPPDDNQLEAKEQQLVVVLRQLFELFGESAETGANINSRIVHRTRNLQGHQVGIEMVADPLTKNHPTGSIPQSGVQDGLMNKLNTATSGLSNNQFFLRGHLLNHNVGGIGTAKNLFPITGEANKTYLNRIETRVKDWIDDDRVVYYKVAVTVDGVDLSHDRSTPDRRLNYVNSKFNVEARAQAKGNEPAESVSLSPIVSRFSPPSQEAFMQANTGTGREEFRITERVRGKSEADALAELMLLSLIGRDRAKKLFDKFSSNENISSYRAIIGINKSTLDEANPTYRIVW